MAPHHWLVCGRFFLKLICRETGIFFRIGTLWPRGWEVGWAGRQAGWVGELGRGLGGGVWGRRGGGIGKWVGERWCGWEGRQLMEWLLRVRKGGRQGNELGHGRTRKTGKIWPKNRPNIPSGKIRVSQIEFQVSKWVKLSPKWVCFSSLNRREKPATKIQTQNPFCVLFASGTGEKLGCKADVGLAQLGHAATAETRANHSWSSPQPHPFNRPTQLTPQITFHKKIMNSLLGLSLSTRLSVHEVGRTRRSHFRKCHQAVQFLTMTLLLSMLCFCQHAEESVEMLVRLTSSVRFSGLRASGYASLLNDRRTKWSGWFGQDGDSSLDFQPLLVDSVFAVRNRCVWPSLVN